MTAAEGAAGVCRLCARWRPPAGLVALAGPGPLSAADLVRQYLALQVEDSEVYPAQACCECLDKLLAFHSFATDCREAQHFFREQLQNVKTECISPKVEQTDTLTNVTPLKHEMVKEEEPEEALNEYEKSDFDNDWIPPEPEQVLVTKKKRGRPRKLKLEYSSSKKKYKREKIDGPIKIVGFLDWVSTPFCCFFCREEFRSRKELKAHEKQHQVVGTDKPWPCIHCDKHFKYKQYMIQHVRFGHEGIVDFICYQCGHTFKTKANLEDHLKTRHSDDRNYQCDKCPKKFKLKVQLVRHMDTHGDTSYKCPKCELVLNSKRTLRNHKAVHDEVGKHICHMCEKRFKTRKALKIHFNTHTGERPYSCLWCPKTFSNNSNCRIHKKRCHPTELYLHEAAAKHNDVQEPTSL